MFIKLTCLVPNSQHLLAIVTLTQISVPRNDKKLNINYLLGNNNYRPVSDAVRFPRTFTFIDLAMV